MRMIWLSRRSSELRAATRLRPCSARKGSFLVFYRLMDFDGDAFRLLDAIAHGDSTQVISGNPQTGNVAQPGFNTLGARGVTQLILRNRPLIARDRQPTS